MDIDNRLYDRTPGVEDQESTASVASYTAGLALAILLTIVSFVVSQTNLLWPPGVAGGLIVLALAQIGVHLVFFLHVGIGSDNTNNVLALAFGMLVVFLVIAGAVGIMADLNYMMPMPMKMPG
jgi:cytochrome o ubiquinol oxidase subunit IV